MADREGPITVDSKAIAVAGTPEFLTADTIINSQSTYVVAAEGNTGANVYIIDSATDAKKIRVPAGGITVPCIASAVKGDVDTSADSIEWMAV